ncbi:MAG: DUF2007 domain-containing protein [Caldisericaceae bacterium]
MKICPKCGTENDMDAKICKNCNYNFEQTETNFEWVLLTTCASEFEADVLSNLLEANNIKTLVKRPGPMGNNFLAVNPFSNILLGPSGEFNIFVMRIDFEEAKKIMEAYSGGEDGTNEDDNEGS